MRHTKRTDRDGRASLRATLGAATLRPLALAMLLALTLGARGAGAQVGRNTGRGFDSASLDLRLSRRWRVGERAGFEVIAEGFNVLNRANLQLPNNVFGAGPTAQTGFGLATAADNPRQIQFGLRLDF